MTDIGGAWSSWFSQYTVMKLWDKFILLLFSFDSWYVFDVQCSLRGGHTILYLWLMNSTYDICISQECTPRLLFEMLRRIWNGCTDRRTRTEAFSGLLTDPHRRFSAWMSQVLPWKYDYIWYMMVYGIIWPCFYMVYGIIWPCFTKSGSSSLMLLPHRDTYITTIVFFACVHIQYTNIKK